MNTFILQPLAPFRLDLTAWVLRRLQINEIDRWDGHTYRRILIIRGLPIEVSVKQTGPPESPELSITTEPESSADEPEIASILTKMLGLDLNLADFYALADSHSNLSPLANRFKGFKPPRFESVFEAIINGISCQQLSLIVGITLLNRLSAAYGLAIGDRHAFPRPEDLVNASVESLKTMGFSGRKAQNILSISRAIVDGELDLKAFEEMDDDQAASALCDIYGIGRWTAQYVELRGMGRLNVYPADDIGGQAKIQRWLSLPQRPDYEAVHQIIDKWVPYRGLIYFLLLLESQAEAGLF